MPLTDRFPDALVFAAQLHGQQTRKGNSNTPYIAHLLAVASLVLEYGGTEDEAIAALLHDAIEDQGGARARETIRQRFGERVTAIVDGCTETDVTPKPPWQERKQTYLAHLPIAPYSVRLVAAADKLHNVRSLLQDYHRFGEALWTRFAGGKAGSLWYYRACVTALHAALQQGESMPILDELDRAVAQLEHVTIVR